VVAQADSRFLDSAVPFGFAQGPALGMTTLWGESGILDRPFHDVILDGFAAEEVDEFDDEDDYYH
jgi:hypothetical protein